MPSGIQRDPSLDTLLDLDGETIVIGIREPYWIKFDVHEVPVTAENPHGLRYSLTLHDPNGERLIGYDNAHPHTSIGMKRGEPSDHSHRFKRVKPYEYVDAAALLMDFYEDVERTLEARGVRR